MVSQGIAISIGVFGFAIVMLFIEHRYPGREFPAVKGWLPRAICVNAFQVAAIFAAGVGWNRWMLRHQILGANRLGTTLGALVGYLALTFVFYWWHLARHRSDFLWRWLHQIHHSAERLELLTAFYKRPAEILIDSVLSSLILYSILGLGPAAASLAVALSGVGELVYHWNIRTPQWFGYFFQRPESHLIHHQAELHDYNYSDLPLWDMLFGTFRNPTEWNARCGFGAGREQHIVKMLLGVDLSRTSIV
jgi:sterol desaturase/sphingolipid hydroxylase (fatty acid hydroxylase superfamily)